MSTEVSRAIALLLYKFSPPNGPIQAKSGNLGNLKTCTAMLALHFRFYSLWDTGYAKIHIPIIASVSEHQPTTWFSFFFDLHILACVFPAGLWYCIKVRMGP